jgi:hypothetical protein
MSDTAPVESRKRFTFVFGNFELVVAILLGVVSIVTAYASFQAALYDSQMAGAYQHGGNLATEAESLYLEGNQQFVQDTQVYNRLTELKVDIESSDPVVAADAQAKYDVLEFQAVSEEFGAAIANADELNAADEEFYYSPLDDEDYQDFLFSDYADTKADSEAVIADGDSFNSFSDQLTLYTVLMSISLFLLGISAVVRALRVQIVLAATGTVIFVVAAILTALVPFVSL